MMISAYLLIQHLGIKFIKEKRYGNLRFLNLRCFSDTMFLASSFIMINKVVIIPQILYHYCLRKDSQIHSINNDDIENFKKYLLKVKDLYIQNNKYEEMRDILNLMAFIHLGVSVMYRASYNKQINFKLERQKVKEYLDENFNGWKSNKFLTFSYSIKHGIKHIGLWAILNLYKLNLEKIFFACYRFIIDYLKIDIKW